MYRYLTRTVTEALLLLGWVSVTADDALAVFVIVPLLHRNAW